MVAEHVQPGLALLPTGQAGYPVHTFWPITRNQPRCGVCTHKLVKNVTTTAGRPRWRCKHCGAASTKSRTDVIRKAEFNDFQKCQRSVGTFHRRPRELPTGGQ